MHIEVDFVLIDEEENLSDFDADNIRSQPITVKVVFIHENRTLLYSDGHQMKFDILK